MAVKKQTKSGMKGRQQIKSWKNDREKADKKVETQRADKKLAYY
jgi:hypothetical protein